MTHAQLVPRFTANEITLDVNPVNPDAFENTTITLQTFAVDIDLYYITWFVNKEEVVSGFGKKSLNVPIGQYGESTFVEILIKAKDGRIVRKTINLRPATVDVLWEAFDSYVPPFYQGKALPSRGAILKVTAIPNLVIGDNYIDHKKLDYTWKWNYRVKDTSSGYNKQFMGIKNLFTNLEEVLSVEVQNTAGTIRGEGETRVTLREPEIIFYNTFPQSSQNNISRALTTLNSKTNTPSSIGIAPYFFSIRPGSSPDLLIYKWLANDEVIASNKKTLKNLLSIELNSKGTTEIKASIQHPTEDFQTARGLMNITSR